LIAWRIPSGPAATSTAIRHASGGVPSPGPTPTCNFVPPISMPRLSSPLGATEDRPPSRSFFARAARQLPEPDDAVLAAGAGFRAVRRKAHAGPLRLVPAEALALFAGFHVPQPHGKVPAPREGQLAVGGEGHATDAAAVAGEGAQLLAAVGVHQHQRVE